MAKSIRGSRSNVPRIAKKEFASRARHERIERLPEPSVSERAKARRQRLAEHEQDDLPGTMGSYPTSKGTLVYPEAKNPATWALRGPKMSSGTAEDRVENRRKWNDERIHEAEERKSRNR